MRRGVGGRRAGTGVPRGAVAPDGSATLEFAGLGTVRVRWAGEYSTLEGLAGAALGRLLEERAREEEPGS